MKNGTMILALMLATAHAHAQDASPLQPEPVVPGQTWTYKRELKTPAGTTVSRTIFRIASAKTGDARYAIEALPAELTGRPTLWTRAAEVDTDSCMVDFYGTGSLGITNSCATTFEPGMDWTTENAVKGKRVVQHYKVEDVGSTTVPAGTFSTVEISATWEAGPVKQRRAKASPTHQITYWYAPETRSMVKVHRRFLAANGAVESESIEELERFRQSIAR